MNPRAVAPGVITLLVLPRFDPINRLWPTPDRLFLQLICDHLDERRLVTSEVYVRGPQYVPVYVTAGIQVRGGFFPDLVEAEARAALNRYLSSLPPGGPEGQGWPLNRRLIRKDLEAVITRVPGVEFVDAIEMGVRTPVDVAEHDLSGLELPMLVGLALRAGPMEPLATVFAPQPAADDGVQVIPVPVRRGPC